MTEQEAIDYIVDILVEHKLIEHNKKLKQSILTLSFIADMHRPVYTRESGGFRLRWVEHCPRCGCEVDMYDKHCRECGQALAHRLVDKERTT